MNFDRWARSAPCPIGVWFQPGDDAKTCIVLKPLKFNIMSISALANKSTGSQSIRCRKNTQQVIGAALERTSPCRLGRNGFRSITMTLALHVDMFFRTITAFCCTFFIYFEPSWHSLRRRVRRSWFLTPGPYQRARLVALQTTSLRLREFCNNWYINLMLHLVTLVI